MAQHPQPPVLLLGSVDAAISQVMAAMSVEATAGVTLSATSLVIAAQTLTQCALRPLKVSNVLFGRCFLVGATQSPLVSPLVFYTVFYTAVYWGMVHQAVVASEILE